MNLRSLAIGLALAGAAPTAFAQVDTFPYTEGFESSAGTFVPGGTNSSWEWGTPDGSFIPAAANGAKAWVTGLDGFYNQFENSTLTFPAFDCTGLVNPTLQFSHIYQHDSPDESWMEISINGGVFSRLGQAGDAGSINWYNDTFNDWWDGTSGPGGAWRLARHDLTGAAGNQVVVRYVMQGGSFPNEDGIGIDDVVVYDTSFADISVASIDFPVSGASLSSAEPISVTLINQGTGFHTGIPLTYSITGPIPATVNETLTGFLPPDGGSATLTFATPADFSVPGDYTITVTANLAADEYPTNDSASVDITAQAVVTQFPYVENFDTDNGGYIAGGTSSSWEYGTPGGTYITGPGSGTSSWVTNLNGFYTTGELSYLQSPPFDLTGMEKDPFLQFSHIYQLDFSDESWVEISTNGGPYVKLGAGSSDPASLNWYNDSFSSWWDGSSGPLGLWRTARHLVPGAAGNVISVRWVIQGGFSINDDGVGVDDVQVFEAPLGSGQPPLGAQALLDVNGSSEVLGFPVTSGQPGPYFTVVSVSSETLDLHFEGAAVQPILLYAGTLQVGASVFPGIGQVDMAPGFVQIASGLQSDGLNPLFVTNLSGSMDLSVTPPLSLVGDVVTLQSVILNPTQLLALTNAVQVAFLP